MAKPNLALVRWSLLAVIVLIAAALVDGIVDGALRVPTKGFQVLLQRASNPFAFWLLAAVYAAIGAGAAWLLWLVQRAEPAASDRVTPARSPASRSAPAPSQAAGAADAPWASLRIESSGRCGQVVIDLGDAQPRFYWEFSGGDEIVSLQVPDASAWLQQPGLQRFPRDAFLQRLADEVARLKCPGARIVISPNRIAFCR